MRTTAAATEISSNFVRQIIRRRHLIWNFVRRDLHSRYVGSMGGLVWSLVHPLVLLASYYFVFQIVLKVRIGTPGDNFAVFVFAAILPWLFMQDTLARSSTSVVDNASLLKKTVFPSEILPLAILGSNLITHILSLLLFAIVLALLGLGAWTSILIPLYILPLMGLAVGLAWFVAALQVFVRDTSQVLAVGLVFWFWFTPIFYRLQDVPAALRPVIEWNPLTFVMEGYRSLLLEGVVPSAAGLAFLWFVGLLALLGGGAVFRSTKREFVDVL